MDNSLPRRLVAEGLGSALLLAVVVGSGIMGEHLADGNIALALLANTLATGAGLLALILTLAPVSGAHFNPVVTLVEGGLGRMAWREVPLYWLAQVAGAIFGVLLAHAMFDAPLISASQHVRSGSGQWLSEGVATFGLVAVIIGCSRKRPEMTPFAVAAFIVSAYWFTASTSFANPAVTLARAMTDSFAGIRLEDVAGFVVAQFAGGVAGLVVIDWLARE